MERLDHMSPKKRNGSTFLINVFKNQDFHARRDKKCIYIISQMLKALSQCFFKEIILYT